MTGCIGSSPDGQRETASTLEAALAYGRKIFPAVIDAKKSHKSAQRSGGRKWGMTDDPEEIKRDWARWPDSRIGLPTGAVNGLFVIETDTPEGHDVDGQASLRTLEAKHGTLPETRKAISPSGSIHYYFLHPGEGIKIKGSAGELAPGIDVRGDGQMVIAPPSINKDGRAYGWLNDLPIAALPDVWLALVTEEPRPRPTLRERATAAVHAYNMRRIVLNGGGNAYANAALRNEIGSLASVGAGTRNDKLNRSAFALGQLVHAGLLNQADVERELINACVANGLVNGDGLPSVHATIGSGFRAAMAKPRRGLP